MIVNENLDTVTPPKIMVVEDEALVAKHIHTSLIEAGYEVTPIVSTGHDAIATARDTLPDLVIMDINLRGTMRGTEAAAYIYERFGIPIIFLTAHTDKHSLSEAKASQPLSYLIKPFDDAELYSNVEMALNKHQEIKKLYEHGQHLVKIIENSQDIIMVVDEDGIIRYATPALTKLLGWRLEEALGNPLWFAAHEDDIEQLCNTFEAAQHATRGHPAYAIEYRHRHREGHYLWLEAMSRPTYEQGKFTGTVWDARLIQERRRKVAMLEQMAFTDTTTGLANERMLAQQGVLMLSKSSSVGLLYINMVDLDDIHSERGQRVSNAVLREAAERLENNVRHNEQDVLARLGSSDFACLFADCDLETAQSLANQVQTLLTGSYEDAGSDLELQVAVGAAVFPDHANDLESLLTAADVAMHQAKRQGSGVVVSQSEQI
jgi:diguanylate cyclase (GGDEF)-like protein/PAS domain S-box-containing protein